ncbi:MAG: hypothetical protein VX278_01100 [Myxococcota bacterium]|nr:hypothetical protein [Myxococcota bacterium]
MLRWTSFGAVSFPETLQLRLSKQHPERIQAGAPLPTKRMRLVEIDENFQYFRQTLNTTRTKPCTSLTLTGLQEESAESLLAIEKLIQQYAFSYVTCHIDTKSQQILHNISSVDRISVAIQDPKQLDLYDFPRFDPQKLRFTIVLNRHNLPVIQRIYQWLQPYSQGSIYFLYPFPLSKMIMQSAPNPAVLDQMLRDLPEDITIAGIPPCLNKRASLKQTSNRWYVDADHQKDKALLFFPDLLRYYKSDSCRFCRLNTQCDGFFQQYLSEDTQLRPLT